MPPISVLMKPSSGMCNLKCEYCFYRDEMEKRTQQSFGFMKEETLKNIIRKTMLRAEGAICYAFQGGEPTLRGIDFFRKAAAYQKQYNKQGIQVYNAFQTNAWLIDEEWCRFFRENGFLVGISLDGVSETHNAYRRDLTGGPTYDRIVRATELLDQYGVEYNILTVVSRRVAGAIDAIYKSYQEHGWNYQQYIACLDPLEEPHGQKEYSLRSEEYGDFLIRLFELWYADVRRKHQPTIRMFDNYIAVLMGYCPEACDQRGTCGIQYVVEADGSTYPCDFYMTDNYLLGNLNNCRLDALDQRRLEIGFTDRSEKVTGACRECRYFYICRGGCQRQRNWNTETGGYENYFCRAYQMFFDACLERLQKVAKVLNCYY